MPVFLRETLLPEHNINKYLQIQCACIFMKMKPNKSNHVKEKEERGYQLKPKHFRS